MNYTFLKRTDIYLLAGVGLLPFFFWSNASVPFEVPKVWLTIAWIMGLAVLTLIKEKDKKSNVLENTSQPLLWSIVAFFGAAVVASLLGVDFPKSVIGNPYRIDGLITLSSFIAFSFLIKDRLTPRFHLPLAATIWLSSVVLSTWAVLNFSLLHFFDQNIPNWYGAIGLNFGQPNFLAGYLLVTIPFGYYLWNKGWSKIGLLTGFILQTAAIATTFSWAAGIGVGLYLLFLLSRKYVRYWQLSWVGLTIFFSIIFIGTSWWKDRGTFIAESRTRIYSRVFTGFLERPLLGWGVANVDKAFESAAKKDEFVHDVYLDKAHSEVLEVMTTTGIIGLFVYFFVLMTLWKNLDRGKKSEQEWRVVLQMVLLLYLFHVQTNVISISEVLMFWLVVGAGLRGQT